jgi:predicted PurR-regulated permease PerM
MTRSRVTVAFLLGLTGVALYLCYLLVAPFLRPIVFSVILGVVVYPAHILVHRWIRNRNAAAALSTTAMILLITVFSPRSPSARQKSSNHGDHVLGRCNGL